MIGFNVFCSEVLLLGWASLLMGVSIGWGTLVAGSLLLGTLWLLGVLWPFQARRAGTPSAGGGNHRLAGAGFRPIKPFNFIDSYRFLMDFWKAP